MASRPSSNLRASARNQTPLALPKPSSMGLKAFLTAVMGLLSVLVFGLALWQNNVLWLWLGFICSLISGIFLQLFIDRKKKRDSAQYRDR
jgi:hypothetical protein